MLEETFPVETMFVDGVAYDYFVVELSIEAGDQARVERYGFRCDENDEWVFARLAIGTYEE